MISVTREALEELFKLRNTHVDWPGACLRVVDRGNGSYGLGIDIRQPGDKYIEYEDTVLLVAAPELAENISHIILDVDDTPEGRELVISESSAGLN